MVSRAKRIEQALKSNDPTLARDVEAARTSTDPDTLASLVSTYGSSKSGPETGVMVAVAQNDATRAADAAPLRDHPVREVRLAWLRRNEATPADLDVLAHDRTIEVRLAVAKHPDTSRAAMRLLCYDKAARVREAAVSHPAVPDDVLRASYDNAMASDDPTYVIGGLLRGLADRTTLPEDLLIKLLGHGDATLALLAKRHPDHPAVIDAVLADGPLSRVRENAAQELARRSSTTDTLNDLTEHPDPETRRILATRRGLPEGVLTRLAMDNDPTVARTALRNSDTPEDAEGMVAVMHGPDPARGVTLTKHTGKRRATTVVYYTLGDDDSYIVIKQAGVYFVKAREDRFRTPPKFPRELHELDAGSAPDGRYSDVGKAPRLAEAKRLLGTFLQQNPT